jgi:hypothetical protein
MPQLYLPTADRVSTNRLVDEQEINLGITDA